MFFQVYGANALAQWGMLLVVLLGLILLNEFSRRSKLGGIITFFVIPVCLTAYFLAIAIGARTGADWGLCVQCMHIGSYDDEPATVAAMHEFMERQGYELDITDKRLHHEIYLSDARKVAPEKLKTVIRHPIRKKET